MREIYDALKDHFRKNKHVDIAEGKGAQGIKHKGKMFAMFYKGDLTVKLNPETAESLIEQGKALPYDPGTGKAMKDRVLIPASKQDSWIEMCELSLKEVST